MKLKSSHILNKLYYTQLDNSSNREFFHRIIITQWARQFNIAERVIWWGSASKGTDSIKDATSCSFKIQPSATTWRCLAWGKWCLFNKQICLTGGKNPSSFFSRTIDKTCWLPDDAVFVILSYFSFLKKIEAGEAGFE